MTAEESRADPRRNPLIAPPGETMLAAHRAGAGIAPENTLMAFKACADATDFRVALFELDLRMTADGELIVAHDAAMDRVSDAAEMLGEPSVPVSRLTLRQIRRFNLGETFRKIDGSAPFMGLRGDDVPEDLRAATLGEMLACLERRGSFFYSMDIKDRGALGRRAADALCETLRRFGCVERTVVATFHGEITRYLDAAHPDIIRSASVLEAADFCLSARLNLRRRDGDFRFRALQIPDDLRLIRLGHRGLIDYAHGHGIAVQYWTINDPTRAENLASIGADAVMTDVPNLIAAALANPSRRGRNDND